MDNLVLLFGAVICFGLFEFSLGFFTFTTGTRWQCQGKSTACMSCSTMGGIHRDNQCKKGYFKYTTERLCSELCQAMPALKWQCTMGEDMCQPCMSNTRTLSPAGSMPVCRSSNPDFQFDTFEHCQAFTTCGSPNRTVCDREHNICLDCRLPAAKCSEIDMDERYYTFARCEMNCQEFALSQYLPVGPPNVPVGSSSQATPMGPMGSTHFGTSTKYSHGSKSKNDSVPLDEDTNTLSGAQTTTPYGASDVGVTKGVTNGGIGYESTKSTVGTDYPKTGVDHSRSNYSEYSTRMAPSEIEMASTALEASSTTDSSAMGHNWSATNVTTSEEGAQSKTTTNYEPDMSTKAVKNATGHPELHGADGASGSDGLDHDKTSTTSDKYATTVSSTMGHNWNGTMMKNSQEPEMNETMSTPEPEVSTVVIKETWDMGPDGRKHVSIPTMAVLACHRYSGNCKICGLEVGVLCPFGEDFFMPIDMAGCQEGCSKESQCH